MSLPLLYRREHKVLSVDRSTTGVPRVHLDKKTTLDVPFARVRTGNRVLLGLWQAPLLSPFPEGNYSMFMEGVVVQATPTVKTVSFGGIMFQTHTSLEIARGTSVVLGLEIVEA